MPERRWLILFVLFLVCTALALQFQAVASAGPLLISALAIDYASLGLLIGLHSLPGVAIAIAICLLGANVHSIWPDTDLFQRLCAIAPGQ
jgi:hypothetical protein